MTLPLSYRRILFTTTALVAITLSAPAMATNVTPVTGADDTNPSAGGPPPLATSTSAGGFNFIAGGDNLYNVTGTTVAVTMDSPATLQQVVTLTGSSVTAVNGDTITISEDNAQISIGSGLTLGNTGLGDTIDFGTTDNSPSGNPANININGILSNSGGGQAINASGVTGGTLNVNLNSTTGSLLGDVSFGLGASNLNITGNGTNDTTGTITGGGVGAVDTLNVNLTGAADTLTLGGALTNLDAMNFNSGITTLGGNIVGGGTATVASGAGLNIAGITSVATTGGLDVNGALTTAASTVLNTNLTMTTANGSITGPIQLGAAGYNATLTNGTFNNTITGGLGTDNITLANLDLTGAIDGGAGTDSVNFTGGAHTNTINNIETLTLANAGTTYANGTAITGLTNALTVGAATTLNANNNITGAGSTFTLNGRVNVGATNVITAGTIGTTGANSFYGVSINPASSASNITVNSALAQNLANTRIDVTKPVGQFIAGGAQYNVFTNNGIGALTIPTAAVVDNSFTTNFVASAGGVGANDLLLTAVRANTYNSVSSNDQNSSVGTALEQYATGVATGAIPGNAQLNTIITNLENMGSGQQIDQAIESLTPAVNGIGEASLSMANASLNTIATRLDSFRNETTRGANSGDVNPYLKGGWVQGYGVFGDQGRREGTPGFESNTYGTALGLDTEKLWKDAIVGVAAGYSNTNVNSKSLNNAENRYRQLSGGCLLHQDNQPEELQFLRRWYRVICL